MGVANFALTLILPPLVRFYPFEAGRLLLLRTSGVGGTLRLERSGRMGVANFALTLILTPLVNVLSI